jgi:hypothetical protein
MNPPAPNAVQELLGMPAQQGAARALPWIETMAMVPLAALSFLATAL